MQKYLNGFRAICATQKYHRGCHVVIAALITALSQHSGHSVVNDIYVVMTLNGR